MARCGGTHGLACSSLVSLDSRYGTWRARLRSSPSAEMTFPSASKPCVEKRTPCQMLPSRQYKQL